VRLTVGTLLGAGLALGSAVTAPAQAAPASAATVAAAPANPMTWGGPHAFSPQVVHTGQPPTGYEVTFRYYDPTATSVRLRGEWYFSDAAHTTTTTSAGYLPSQWKPGDFPIAFPNQGAAPNWPVVQMTLNPRTGVWSYTTPLPSGVFTYGFYVNCTSTSPTLADCTELSDPSNRPWNTTSDGTAIGSVEPTSQVYVPSDPRFGTPDLSWQAPNRRHHGTLEDVSYPDPQSTNPVGSHPLAVYLPPGYNAHRRVRYPTLYLSHGGGGNEVDWSTQGAAGNILDNLIARHQVQPMVVVMTNFNNLGTCTGQDVSCYATDVREYVIPFVESHYNVSTKAGDRAFAGLSAGGRRANYLLFHETTLFGYFASWSIGTGGAPAPTDPLWQNPALRTRLGIHIGGGIYDSITIPGIDTYEAQLTAAGIPFTDDRIAGGHEWYTWRQNLYDFLTTMAFRHTTTSLQVVKQTRNVVVLGVTVTPDTTEPAQPKGTVQLVINGQPVGSPKRLHDGYAELRLSPYDYANLPVTVVYGGDRYYNGSTATGAH